MGFVPKYDDVVASKSGVCPEGRTDFTISAVELGRSNDQAKQITMRYTADSGANANHRVVDYFTFSEKGMELAFENLKAISEAAGHPWGDEVEELEQLAEHFAQPGIRFSADVRHRHQIKDDGTYKTVRKEELDAWVADGGEGNTRVSLFGYGPAENEPEIEVKRVTFGGKEAGTPEKKAKAKNRVDSPKAGKSPF